MPKIHKLAPEEAKKVAAGEVAERPANVVKELVENALDAGATEISIFIEEGGKNLIRVVDNGSGMSKEDALLCIEHHATSKITTVADLATINTFGFRGEALSSISAVSKMTLATKEAESNLGVNLTIKGGSIIDESVTSLNTGTDITIADLFYNVPARQKFLKSKDTEWRAIVQLFHAFCLSYKDVSFRLLHNGRQIHTIPKASTLEDRISQIFEPALRSTILVSHATHEKMNLSLTVACSPRDYTRFDKSQIFCFVNNRWVKNYKLGQSLIKGYQGILPPQRYPAGVLFITLDSAFVDINIHPRKEEVQFLYPRIIENLIEETIEKRLEQAQQQLFTPSKKVFEPYERPVVQPLAAVSQQLPIEREDAPLSFLARPETPPKEIPTLENQDAFLKAVTPYFSEENDQAPVHQQQIIVTDLNYHLIGQVLTTYILIEAEGNLIYIDQHAAHERIVYERLKAQFENIARVQLLFPQVVHLSQTDLDLLEPHLELLREFGIESQRSSVTELIIKETPLFVKNQSLEDCIKQAVAVLNEHLYLDPQDLQKIIQERIHAMLSCKTAVKAGDTLSNEEMHNLINELYSIKNKLTCPHGRPTLWEFKTSELEKKFKRDYR
jgi:DNA mismatch repair protein MutL